MPASRVIVICPPDTSAVQVKPLPVALPVKGTLVYCPSVYPLPELVISPVTSSTVNSIEAPVPVALPTNPILL